MADFKDFPSFEEDLDENQEEMVIMSPEQIAELNESMPPEKEDVDDSEDQNFNDTDTDDPNTPEENPAAVGVYKALVEKGIFHESEDFDGTFNTLERYFDEIPNKTRDAVISEAPDTGKEVVEYILKGGSALSNEDILEFMDQYRKGVQITEVDDISTAEGIVEAELLKLGFDEEQIELNIDLLKGKGEDVLLAKAREYQDRNKPNLEQEIARAEEARLEQERNAREFTESIFSTLEETNYTKQRKQEIQEAIKSDKITDVLVEAVSNPQSLIQLATLVLNYNKDKGFDLTEFAKQVASKDIQRMQSNAFEDNFGTYVPSQTREQSNDKDRFSNIEFVKP